MPGKLYRATVSYGYTIYTKKLCKSYEENCVKKRTVSKDSLLLFLEIEISNDSFFLFKFLDPDGKTVVLATRARPIDGVAHSFKECYFAKEMCATK